MDHFVVNLKSYLMFEVLEGGWKNLVREIEGSQTLDEVISAHDQYLQRICRKSLLRSDQSNPSSSLSLGARINELLVLCGEFCDFQEDLFGEALQAAERAAERRCEAETRLNEGDWGLTQQEVEDELPTARQFLTAHLGNHSHEKIPGKPWPTSGDTRTLEFPGIGIFRWDGTSEVTLPDGTRIDAGSDEYGAVPLMVYARGSIVAVLIQERTPADQHAYMHIVRGGRVFGP